MFMLVTPFVTMEASESSEIATIKFLIQEYKNCIASAKYEKDVDKEKERCAIFLSMSQQDNSKEENKELRQENQDLKRENQHLKRFIR